MLLFLLGLFIGSTVDFSSSRRSKPSPTMTSSFIEGFMRGRARVEAKRLYGPVEGE
jgi:hypothetical protein